jgi:hypothetical protein
MTLIPDPPLPFIDDPVPNNPEGRNLREDAARWLAEHPSLYGDFESAALALHAEGKRFGIGLLAERIRWTNPARYSGFKINNNHRAYIARQLVSDHPELLATLRFRKTRY